MWKTIEKLAAVFCVIVFITFMINHGNIDFSGVDWARNKTIETINSEQGQEYINETKEISRNVFHDLFYGLKRFITGDDSEKPLTTSSDYSSSLLSSTQITLSPASYLYAYDGDTIVVAIDGQEYTVRLIGIDTPESVNPDESKNNEYGVMASEYTKTLLSSISDVYLEFDKSSEDQYGRLLAYVYLTDDRSDPTTNMLNAILVENGYAVDKVYMPNDKYSTLFYDLCIDAQTTNAGLWVYDGFKQLW